MMKLPAASWGVSRAELRRSPTRLRSHELRRGRLAIVSGRIRWRRPILSAPSCRVSWRRRM